MICRLMIKKLTEVKGHDSWNLSRALYTWYLEAIVHVHHVFVHTTLHNCGLPSKIFYSLFFCIGILVNGQIPIFGMFRDIESVKAATYIKSKLFSM